MKNNNKFYDELVKTENFTTTENGAVALKSTLNKTVDLFATINSMRMCDDKTIIQRFQDAYDEDGDLATKMLFWSRNIRGGQGERRTFRVILRYLATVNPELVRRNLDNIVYFGRWDDLYCLDGTPLEDDVYSMFKKQLNLDKSGVHGVSLLAKWLKSVNAHSEETNRLGRKTAKKLGMSEKEYRKTLKELRSAINVVETQMSANHWHEIDYESVPSIAHKNYRNAFRRHDEEGYNKFLEDVNCGEKTIKADTLYPYNIVRAYLDRDEDESDIDDTLEVQWRSLPDYLAGEKKDMLVIADTSGSMFNGKDTVKPIHVSLSLALYFAQRNRGLFHNYFMTFSSKPTLVKVNSNAPLKRNLDECMDVDWGYNTNLEAAFDLILKMALRSGAKQEELPSSLVIITDMQFDCSLGDEDDEELTFLEEMKKKYEENGYTLPHIVFWNVNASYTNGIFQTTHDDSRVQYISGASASAFRDLIRGESLSPLELVLNTLNTKEYDRVVVPSVLGD